MKVEICQFNFGEDKVWDHYVSHSDDTGHCHLSGWSKVIKRSYGHSPLYIWARENDVIKGILPLILFRSITLERSLISLPYLDDGGVCADSQVIESALFDKAVSLFEEYNLSTIELRHRFPSNLDLPTHGSKVTLVLSLCDTSSKMWKTLDAKVRNQIRKAQKASLEISWCGREGIKDFYSVFASNMRDLGSPVHSQKFFVEILNEFSTSAKIILVKKAGVAIAGGLCLHHNATLSIPWASSLKEHRKLCPNNMLYWEAIRWACDQGVKVFDFGRSSPGSGTYNFKKQWGAKEASLHWQFRSRQANSVTIIDSDNPQYGWVIRSWQLLPLVITNRVGPKIRGRLSN